MPTSTPSPHRFLTRPRSATKTEPHPPSKLRHAFPTQISGPARPRREEQVDAEDLPRITPAKRFVIAPVSSSLKGKGKERTVAGWAFEQAEVERSNAGHLKPARTLQRVESIEGSSQSSPITSSGATPDANEDYGTNDEPASDGHIETSIEETNGRDEDEDADMLFTPEHEHKRRRIFVPAEQPTSPPRPPSPCTLQPPQTPGQARSQTPAHTTVSSHRFRMLPPKTPGPFNNSSHAASSQTLPTLHRPHFILPPQETSSLQPAQPLPEHFSPSRKGQKYIPGGLASTVQSWIIETANTGFAAQTRDTAVWGRDREDGVKLRVKIRSVRSGHAYKGDGEGVECFNGGVVFVRAFATDVGAYNASRMPGSTQNEDEIRVLLAGQGGARGSGGVRVREGSVVGIRAPLWDVEVQGQKWVVAVDWILL